MCTHIIQCTQAMDSCPARSSSPLIYHIPMMEQQCTCMAAFRDDLFVLGTGTHKVYSKIVRQLSAKCAHSGGMMMMMSTTYRANTLIRTCASIVSVGCHRVMVCVCVCFFWGVFSLGVAVCTCGCVHVVAEYICVKIRWILLSM